MREHFAEYVEIIVENRIFQRSWFVLYIEKT